MKIIKAGIAIAVVFFLATAYASAQDMYCHKQGKNLPDNDCAPCTPDAKYSIIIKAMLEMEEISRMEEEMNKMVAEMDSYYKTYGNLKQKYFNELDLDLKKLYDEAKNNPQRAMELISWMEGELEKGGCTKTTAFDSRSAGVSSGLSQQISESATQSVKNLTYPNYTGRNQLSFDCCDPSSLPNDVVITNAQSIHNEFTRFKAMFEDFKLLYKVQIQSVQMAVWHFQKYDKSSADKMKQLTNQSFCNVVTNALAQSGAMSASDADWLNKQIKLYYETNDKLSVMNGIRQTLGDDVADAMQFMFNNYTATDLAGSLGDMIKNNPAKFKAIQGLGSTVAKGASWLGSFMNLVSIAEASVNVFFDTFLKLGGNSFVIKTQNDLWCVAAYYYYYAMQSTLSNAAALYRIKQAHRHLSNLFPSPVVIPVDSMNGLTAETAQQQVASQYNTKTSKGSINSNKYSITLPDNKTTVFVFGNYFCGKLKKTEKPETTPDPKIRKRITFTGGFICGTGWINDNGIIPLYDDMNTAGFVTKHQNELNTGFGGTTFAKGDAIQVTTGPSLEFGLGFGCAVNHTWEVRLDLTGGMQQTTAETDVRVVKLVPPASPSQPPTTQQTTQTVEAKSNTTILRMKLGPQINFDGKVQPFAGAGICVGMTLSGKREYTVASTKITETGSETIPMFGLYVNGGVRIPVAEKLNFKIQPGCNLLFPGSKMAVNPELRLALEVKF